MLCWLDHGSSGMRPASNERDEQTLTASHSPGDRPRGPLTLVRQREHSCWYGAHARSSVPPTCTTLSAVSMGRAVFTTSTAMLTLGRVG